MILTEKERISFSMIVINIIVRIINFKFLIAVIQEYKKSVMYDEHPIIRHCMSFGVSYFIYDTIAMFIAFQEKYKEVIGSLNYFWSLI